MVTHKLVGGHLHNCFDLRLASDIHHHDTRYRHNFYISQRGGRFEESNILISGLYLFNQLPPSIREESNVKKFKNVIRRLIFHPP